MENSRFKKIIIIIAFIAVVAALGFALYYIFFRPPAPPPSAPYFPSVPKQQGKLPSITNENVNTQVTETGPAGLPSIETVPKGAVISDKARGGYTKVTTKLEAGLFPTADQNGNLIYYDSATGRFYRLNADGSLTLLSDQRFFAVENVTWTKTGDKAVLEYPDGSNIVYDFGKNKQYTLPPEMQEFSFANNGQMLAAEAIGDRVDTNWLVTSNPDGSNIKFVEPIGDQAGNVDVNVSPNNQVVALFRENAGINSQKITFIGQQSENFKNLVTTGRGFEGIWTPDGSRLLYSVFRTENGFRPTLYVATASGDQIGAINLELGLNTWSNKCVIASKSDFAYCAVPKSLPPGSGVYPALAENSADNFYQIDLASGQSNLLAEPVGSQPSYSATSVFLSADEKTLYFKDKSGAVYSLSLP